jgi:L-rhamnose isomerase/sugar isomerase
MSITDRQAEHVLSALDRFEIELPSWGFSDSGTRFGVFRQPAAAVTIAEKLHDAGAVHRLTGAAPSVAPHVDWDFPDGVDIDAVKADAARHGVRIGAINPNYFQDQVYKFGSFCSPWPEAREKAMAHTRRSIRLGAATGSTALSVWLADGTNYPGQDSIYRRKKRLEEACAAVHAEMAASWPGAQLLLEYKPFEPAFYHTDIGDWGMAASFARKAGPNAKVLVDTGHHFQGQNIEHIVAFLLDEGLLGGFHFNDRKYADDDLTLGSIDPYAVFRIFDQIAQFEHDRGQRPGSEPIAYMVDQSHNLKPKIEAMVQTVCEAQALFAKAHLVDRGALELAQNKADVTAAEGELRKAFFADVTPILEAWRRKRGLPASPLAALRESGLIEKLAIGRAAERVK